MCVSLCLCPEFISFLYLLAVSITSSFHKLCYKTEMGYQIPYNSVVYEACRHVSYYHLQVYLGTWSTTVFTPSTLCTLPVGPEKSDCAPHFSPSLNSQKLFQLLALPGIALQSQKSKEAMMTTPCCKAIVFKGFAGYKVSSNCSSFQYGIWKIFGSPQRVRSASSYC